MALRSVSRPRLPSSGPPPSVSSISISPESRSRSGRTLTLRRLCRQVQAVSELPRPSTRCKLKALTPFFWLGMNHIASTHIRTGLGVSWNTVPAVSEGSPSHARPRNTPCAITHGSPTTPQCRHTNPAGQRKRRMSPRQPASLRNQSSMSWNVRGDSTPGRGRAFSTAPRYQYFLRGAKGYPFLIDSTFLARPRCCGISSLPVGVSCLFISEQLH